MNVEVVEYSPNWKTWFQTIENRLADAIKGIDCNIEHVGSTSVEGLAAKPIIDIDIILTDFSDFESTKSALKSVGYAHRGSLGLEGREMFSQASPDYPHHLYVCDPNCLAVKNHITFRDHLRLNIQTASEYAALKKALAEKFSTDVDSYCEAKSEFIANVLAQCHFKASELNAIKNSNTIDNDKASSTFMAK
ncbi:GrpB family protein [uncultured Shewanella sp.]|uniref:GrpB family protein n=1 Tax=uncultured Shewanella sp. TaxID=173975 RepID=UPI00260CF496|nr:GrpB family protein [uncultured Shewanella sp.]